VSLDAQRAKLTAYALAMDLELVEIIVDEGRSAKTLERQGLQAALSMLAQGKADALLVTKLDRLTRSVKDLGFLVDRYFASGRYSLLSVSDSIDTRSPSGRLVLNVLGSVAQWEREAVVERTKEAMAEMKAQGYQFGFPPFGFRYAAELDAQGRRLLEQDPAQQAGLRRILALFDAGTTAEDIARKLNAEHVPKGRRGAWHRTIVYRILKREGRLPSVIRPYKPRKSEAELVRERDAVSVQVQKLRGEGLSLRQIGKRLAASGYGPPRGNRWYPSTIAALLDEHQAA
jgi:site-specific DNA recombinase